MCFFVVTNWFLCTDVANYGTMLVLCYCGIPPKNFYGMPDCVRNVHHISKLPDFLAVVPLAVPLDVSRMTLMIIPKR